MVEDNRLALVHSIESPRNRIPHLAAEAFAGFENIGFSKIKFAGYRTGHGEGLDVLHSLGSEFCLKARIQIRSEHRLVARDFGRVGAAFEKHAHKTFVNVELTS